MSDPETKDFGKEIIPQAVGNRNILSYTHMKDIGQTLVILTPSLKQILG
jgi:hypothetical protein